MYNVRNSKHNESMFQICSNMFQISNNAAHNLRSNEVNFSNSKANND